MWREPAVDRQSCGGQRGRSRRAAAVAGTLAITVTACTGHAAPPVASATGGTSPRPAAVSGSSSAATASSPRSAPAAELRPQTQPTTVIAGASAEQVSIAVSAALFISAPVAVVSAPDATSITRGVDAAERIGVPLLVDGQSLTPATAPPAPTGSTPGDTEAGGVDAELARLGCRDVLVVGTAPPLHGVRVVGDPAQLPQLSATPPERGTAVLVHPTNDAGTLAATATAKAAGATVVVVHGNDPRTDPYAVGALADTSAQHVLAVGASFGPADQLAAHVAIAKGGQQLPGGGQVIFPGRRFVALYGHPGGAGLGVLGAQDLDASIARARAMASQYDALSDVPVVPTFEIIATVASGSAGDDGDYSNESSVESLRPWVEKAESSGLYVVLDLQPGRADPLAQAKLYTSLLELPDVGLAVDPEWALGPNQLPLKQIGSLDSSRINAVGAWLDGLTASKHLPQKLFVVHQFRLSMIGNESKLKTDYDNLALLIHMDGQGAPANKDATWRSVVATAPKGVPFGWKNFYKEDHPMLTPEQTMAHKPQPLMISYQ
jgi:hypothetical protein